MSSAGRDLLSTKIPGARLRTFLPGFAPLAAALVASGALLLWMAPAAGWLPPLEIYNTSPSVPLGRYWLTQKWPPQRGDIVMVRDPKGFVLPWLLKRVEGVGGDRFCWHESENRHYINERPMPAIPPEAYAMGIPIWKGCRRLEPDEVAGYGEHFLAFGSQYLGPVKIAQLWGVYALWE